MIKFPKEVRNKWLEALRSGKYTQSKQYLKRKDGSMCCLGVLCDIQGVGWVDVGDYYVTSDSSYAWPTISDVGSEVYTAISDGVYDPECQKNDSVLYTVLGHMNDMYGKSFEEIADYIEANTEGV